jgi:hypothetical protein
MAPAGSVVVVALSLLYLSRAIFSTEYLSTLTFFNSELHKHGCSSPSEWEEYTTDCGKRSFNTVLPRPRNSLCRQLAKLTKPILPHPLTGSYIASERELVEVRI